MERNILDLSPNANLVIDINMIWAVDINGQGDGCRSVFSHREHQTHIY